MNKKVMKTAFAAICVVAAGISGMNAYNSANQSRAEQLLAANVEALSDNYLAQEQEYNMIRQCPFPAANETCSYYFNGTNYPRYNYTNQGDRSDNMKAYYEGED